MSVKVGDTVQLKSGGPDMTAIKIGTAGEEPMVWCAWFDGTKDAYGLFPPEALKASPEPQRKAAPQPQLQALPDLRPTEVDKAPPEPQPTPKPEPTEADTALVLEKTRSFTWRFAKSKPLPTDPEAAPVTPEAVEAKQDPQPTEADSAPHAEKKDKSLEEQIASMQSLISNLLKRS